MCVHAPQVFWQFSKTSASVQWFVFLEFLHFFFFQTLRHSVCSGTLGGEVGGGEGGAAQYSQVPRQISL